jgi:hypothetical protein
MATFSVSPMQGVDLVNTVLATDLSSGARTLPHRLGEQVWGNDGKRYVFAQAGGSITASNAACTVNASTFSATGSGGSYTSPATAMSTGDYGWFAAASV